MVDTLLNNEGLSAHNQLRARHGSPPLTYDSSLARSAQVWANELAKTKCMRHSDQETYGENLAYAGATSNANLTASEATRMWYDQIDFHNFDGELTYESCYFTQLIWKGTKFVGFGKAVSYDGTAAYIVAHYSPKGNLPGLFAANVSQERPESTTVSYGQYSRSSLANSTDYTPEETKKERKQREKEEKKQRKEMEKMEKERLKQEKKLQKEREKQEKKEKRKSTKG